MFTRVTTKSAKKATAALFDQALPLLAIVDEKHIQSEFDSPVGGLMQSWGSRFIVKGTQEELRDRVLTNLEKTAELAGFDEFIVDFSYNYAQVISSVTSISPCVSVRMWKAADSFYLCGNLNFE